MLTWLSRPGTSQYFFFVCFVVVFKRFYLFIWESERAQAGGAAEGEEEAGSLLSREAQRGIRSQDPGIMTWAEGRRLTNWATQAPQFCFVFEWRRDLLQDCLLENYSGSLGILVRNSLQESRWKEMISGSFLLLLKDRYSFLWRVGKGFLMS